MIVKQEIDHYIQTLTPLEDPLLLEMEKLAKKEQVPIIQRPAIQFIRNLLLFRGNVERILEIGTAIGYSTIWLAKACPQAIVDSLERDEQRFAQAEAFVQRAELTERIHLHLTDALTYAEQLKDQRYDVLFIDAAKGQYQHFFELYTPLVKSGGVVITDNVLFHGLVVEEEGTSKRLRPLVQKIKRYNQWLGEQPQFETAFLPIGDGLAISVKR